MRWDYKKIITKRGVRAKMGESNHLLPPVQGWEYLDVVHKWQSDPTMVCSRQVSPLCTEVIVELHGVAMEKHPDCAGSYLPVEGEHIRGRLVGSFQQSFQQVFCRSIQRRTLNLCLMIIIRKPSHQCNCPNCHLCHHYDLMLTFPIFMAGLLIYQCNIVLKIVFFLSKC